MLYPRKTFVPRVRLDEPHEIYITHSLTSLGPADSEDIDKDFRNAILGFADTLWAALLYQVYMLSGHRRLPSFFTRKKKYAKWMWELST